MKIELSFEETRVLGAMIEKEITTPDQYPLSVNGLMNACNQKSNREPVVNFDEALVQQTLDELSKKRLVSEDSRFGGRVTKYKHRFANSEFGELKLTAQELGIITVLFLRGFQTPGELRSRTNRLCTFTDVREVEGVLQGLITRDDGPFVVKLEREPGRRENRYAHLFSGPVSETLATSHIAEKVSSYSGDTQAQRIETLEKRVDELEQRLNEIAELLN